MHAIASPSKTGLPKPCQQGPVNSPTSRRVTSLQIASVPCPTESLSCLASLGASSSGRQDNCDVAVSNPHLGRRSFLALSASLAVACTSVGKTTAQAQEEIPSSSKVYRSEKQGYVLYIPDDWDVKDKAGADVLFEDPARRSTNVGITVSPVRRVNSLPDFGSLEDVGSKLMEAERKKESTLSVELLSSRVREGRAGALLYDYEYELDSTRGRKRVLNTVAIANARLYILNGVCKCGKEACGSGELAELEHLRTIASSFDVSLL